MTLEAKGIISIPSNNLKHDTACKIINCPLLFQVQRIFPGSEQINAKMYLGKQQKIPRYPNPLGGGSRFLSTKPYKSDSHKQGMTAGKGQGLIYDLARRHNAKITS